MYVHIADNFKTTALLQCVMNGNDCSVRIIDSLMQFSIK